MKEAKYPIGKDRPFILFIKWFLSFLVLIIGLHHGIVKPTELDKRIFTQSSEAWIYYHFVTILIALLASSIRLWIYYHKLYTLYRNRAIVDNVYLDRSHIQGQYLSIINETKKYLMVCGMSLHTLLDDVRVRDAIVKKAKDQKITIRFILHHPDCRYIKDRAVEEGKKADRISQDCSVHLEQLKELIDKISKEKIKGDISVVTLANVMPSCFYMIKDDHIYIEPYLYPIFRGSGLRFL
jgi:hypothetical protein